ncbi:LuxR C-terminal-related transcriptional regulator (plasmid) [Enterobacter asburiae]|jgi:DNA-binding CsgD family transcriptional regulator|uniref:LuxR C-terminal-related transcriptional regulator n=1 Tax=Enterobacter asburiae TaxID=61645 RepID=UPI0029335FFB|nr:hypothetical protein [Enterobacter asburiae]EMA4739905.1 hypothetical protein [Enterobacter asburiae]
MDDEGKQTNVFFEHGVSSLKSLINGVNQESMEKIKFVFFHTADINSLLSHRFDNNDLDKKYIIISTAVMKPIAMYFYARYTNILAVLDASESVQRIAERVTLSCLSSKREIYGKKRIRALTNREFLLLSLTMKGFDIWKIAMILNISMKKAYSCRMIVCQKMGVRKMAHLKFTFTQVNK